MNLGRDPKVPQHCVHLNTNRPKISEPGGPEFRGLESSGVLCQFFSVAHLSSHSFATKGIIKQSSPSGVRRNSLRNGENEGEQRGRRNTDIIQWHNRGPLNPHPPPHNLITPLLLPHPTPLPIPRTVPILVPSRMHCLRRNCSSVRCATRDLNKVSFLFFFTPIFISPPFSASLAAYLMRSALAYPVWVDWFIDTMWR